MDLLKFRSIVFSTYVEVILGYSKALAGFVCILHVCGGDPKLKSKATSKLSVFSTYVEVILFILTLKTIPRSILHVCGGDPKLASAEKQLASYSPRMWR